MSRAYPQNRVWTLTPRALRMLRYVRSAQRVSWESLDPRTRRSLYRRGLIQEATSTLSKPACRCHGRVFSGFVEITPTGVAHTVPSS